MEEAVRGSRRRKRRGAKKKDCEGEARSSQIRSEEGKFPAKTTNFENRGKSSRSEVVCEKEKSAFLLRDFVVDFFDSLSF